MPDGMTYEKMNALGFHNTYEMVPETKGEYEVMCKAGHIHKVNYCGNHRWTIPKRCGWEFGWWREVNV